MRDPIFAGTTTTTYANYLEAEEKSKTKHEFVGGKIRAMAGGTPKHSRLAMNLSARLFIGLDGKPCQPNGSDQRIRIEEIHESFYPDVLVSCPPEEYSPFDRNALINPTLVAEVLSPGTRDYDKNQKFAAYSLIPSLTDLIFIETEFVRLEHFTRSNSAQKWVYSVYYKRADTLEIESLGVTLNLEELYRGIEAPDALTLPFPGEEAPR